jgi:hypothetical protein
VVLSSDGGCGAAWDARSRAASGHGAGIEGELATGASLHPSANQPSFKKIH